MDGYPDVAGLPLSEAIEQCKALGFEVDIVITRPVRDVPGGKLRAVRFNIVSKNNGVLTVVVEDTRKGGG
ncbi:MAG: hypothetical protein A4E55_00438 [Pelotomaculum sp. PtaU1.Bin035]|nr:MAG: hypothetical protein A4E55_00438 [Pelotomaculum sp. PtaU1.Bin035]